MVKGRVVRGASEFKKLLTPREARLLTWPRVEECWPSAISGVYTIKKLELSERQGEELEGPLGGCSQILSALLGREIDQGPEV